MSDSREDTLAKAREALEAARPYVHSFARFNADKRAQEILPEIDAALAALSAPPSQSESDDEKLVEAMWREIDRVPATETLRDGIRAALSLARAQWERRSTLPSLPSPPDPDDATLATTKSVLHVAIETLRGQLKNPDSQAIRDALDFYEQEFG